MKNVHERDTPPERRGVLLQQDVYEGRDTDRRDVLRGGQDIHEGRDMDRRDVFMRRDVHEGRDMDRRGVLHGGQDVHEGRDMDRMDVHEKQRDVHLGGEGTTFQFLHPYTMLVAGPSSCGKTTFVTGLLQQALNRISPAPQRIVWLYKRWQPLYSNIQATVVPRVEFMQGIPSGIEGDEFFNPRMRNLLIVDDLMASATKDPRITEIFYEGSHHRNLSIIQNSQNLYYSKDPTQRRNCHYVVLFKNPIDKQSIMTFARQMWPHKSREFIDVYENATVKPHGYLLVDLKQGTKEADRLQPNILEEDKCINRATHLCPPQSEKDSERVHSYNIEEMHNNMFSCDDCGVMLDTIHDLQRHVKKWCSERNDMAAHDYATTPLSGNRHTMLRPSNMMEEPTLGEPVKKKLKLDKQAEKNYYTFLRKRVSEVWKKDLDDDQQRYMDDGYDKAGAKAKAVNDNIKAIRKDLYEEYAQLIEDWLTLSSKSALHQKVMDKVNELHTSMNLDWLDAAHQTIKEYKPLINTYILPEIPVDEDSSEEDTGDDEDTDSI